MEWVIQLLLKKQKPIGSTIKIHKKVVNGVVNDSNPNDVYTPRRLFHR